MPSQILLTMADLETGVPLNAALEAAGFTTAMVSPLDDAPAAMRREHPDLLILTGAVHEASAQLLLRLAREQEVFTLGLLEPTDTERGGRHGRLPATALLVKPVPTDEAVATARRLVDRRRLQQHTGISGQSPSIHEVLVKIEQMAPVTSTVLVQGESGSGKELVAKALHDLSPRRGQAFIAVNCAALPESLLESELFGHEKGAFTGAVASKPGLVELADGGTLFLDEIGEMEPDSQVKLLRALETGTFFRVGGTRPRRVDVRIVAATNRDLAEAMRHGEFRQDLYYRINTIAVSLPPLRDRREDIGLLARHFVEGNAAYGVKRLGVAALAALEAYAWPGNVRELQHAIERAVILGKSDEIQPEDLPPEVAGEAPIPAALAAAGSLEGMERQHIVTTLRQVGGHRGKAAALLEIDPKTLYRKVLGYRITPDEFR